MLLFISHSTQDKPLVRLLVQMIRGALDLPPAEIRCSSLEGYQLPGGADIAETLRDEVQAATAFVGLITYHSLQSTYVAFEMGARWGGGKPLIPLLAPGMDQSVLKGPLSLMNALHCDQAAHLHQLVAQLGDDLATTPRRPMEYQKPLAAILEAPKAFALSIPQELQEMLREPFASRRTKLPQSQQAIFNFLLDESRWRASVSQTDFEQKFPFAKDTVYWRLESLCHLGFVEKEVTSRRGEKPTFHYRLTPQCRAALLPG